MSELCAAAERLSRARASYETRPDDERGYVALLEAEKRFLRAENLELRAAKAAAERALRERRRRAA